MMYELMQCGCGAYQGDPCRCDEPEPTAVPRKSPEERRQAYRAHGTLWCLVGIAQCIATILQPTRIGLVAEFFEGAIGVTLLLLGRRR